MISSKNRPHFVTFLLGVKESLPIINLLSKTVIKHDKTLLELFNSYP